MATALATAHVSAADLSVAAYFPMTPGTVWTYRTNTSGEVQMRVGPWARVGGYDCRIIETIVSGSTTQRECYRVAADGVYAHQRTYADGNLLLEPPQRVLAAPVVVGQVWQWIGRAGDQQVTFQYTWARREMTAVPAGQYEAMQLYFEGNIGPQVRIQSWRWFARGVGMVKEDSMLAQGQQMIRVYAELVSVTTGR
ncbi:MAG: hypothetical protein HY355_06055 [Armatimonadetes bacterium]|nr:hypothetical protein [Armatimonadota bacterium]